MKYGHFEAIRPVCPACRGEGEGAPLRLGAVWREADGALLEGALHCSDPRCQREHPVLDGVPVLVTDLAAHLSAAPLAFLGRSDLSAGMRSLLGDALGAGSAHDQARQRLAIYAHSHWSDRDALAPEPSSAASLFEALFALLDQRPAGLALDLGCGPGRAALELASRTEGLVLGLDLDFQALRLGATLLRAGRVEALRRRVGLVYEARSLARGEAPAADRVDLWMADALALPLRPGTVGLITALNLLDSCSNPWALLHEIAGLLGPGGRALLACPYDWAPNATPTALWLGGHSQRGEGGGAAEAALRCCFQPGHPRAVPGLALLAEHEDLPWRLRLHDRSEVRYRTHGVLVGR